MEFVYSKHWKFRFRKRVHITEDVLEYAILHSKVFRDRRWLNASNAIARIPPSGRLLKVSYRKISENKVKIITAFWIN